MTTCSTTQSSIFHSQNHHSYLLGAILLSASATAQISKDSVCHIAKYDILNNKLDSLIIVSETKAVSPRDTIWTLNSYIISPDYQSWFFFVDEQPLANWGHRCKYVFVNRQNASYVVRDMYMPPREPKELQIHNMVAIPGPQYPDSLILFPTPKNVAVKDNEYAVIK